MPVDGKNAAEFCYIFDQWQHGSASLLVGQVHVGGIKQRCVHDVQWQFEQMFDVEVLENLSCSRAVSDRFVVADRRIIGETGFLERQWRL